MLNSLEICWKCVLPGLYLTSSQMCLIESANLAHLDMQTAVKWQLFWWDLQIDSGPQMSNTLVVSQCQCFALLSSTLPVLSAIYLHGLMWGIREPQTEQHHTTYFCSVIHCCCKFRLAISGYFNSEQAFWKMDCIPELAKHWGLIKLPELCSLYQTFSC